MKNRLLFTTALIAAAFAVSDARAERLVVSSGEEEAVNAEMSANDNSELQGGAILNSGKLTVATASFSTAMPVPSAVPFRPLMRPARP